MMPRTENRAAIDRAAGRDAERKRMNYTSGTARTRPSTRPVLVAVLAAFVLGGAVAGYGVWRFAPGLQEREAQPQPATIAPSSPVPGITARPTPTATAAEDATQAVQAVQIVAEQQGGIDQRLAAAEQRIARLDLRTQAAGGNAARAEGLLIAFSARRTLERGNELGYLADQLRLRFGDAMPNAVSTLVDFGRRPVTIDQLVARLDGLAPALAESDRQVTWERITRELSGLFVVRRETTPSPQPRLRLERARLFLQSGRVGAAVAEVRGLPGAANASRWIADAQRYAAAQNALELIETAAVLEPRRLRDGEGNPVEQSSPATAPTEEPSGA